MWTRKELKKQAKAALKRNYWKAVLVTTLVMALVGGTGGAAGSGVTLIGSSAEGGNSLWTYGFNYLHDYLPALLTVILIISVVAVLVALAVTILLVNPVTAPVEIFRYAVLGQGTIVPAYLLLSWVITLLVALFGVMIFNHVEKTFMDTV